MMDSSVVFNKEIVMSIEVNPYSKLVRMLELRLARQRQALADSELQLQGSIESKNAWDQRQLDLYTKGTGKK
jgi:hypothetical protein